MNMFGSRTLDVKHSLYNGEIKVIKTFGLGIHIKAGGLTQSGGIIESMWNATLKPLKNKGIENVLILGLGGGTVVKVIKKYWGGAKITGIDIDPVIVDLGIKHLNLNNSDLKIEITDALNFVKKQKTHKLGYDLIIVDLYKGDLFPDTFSKSVFLGSVKSILTPDGFVIFNRVYGKKDKDGVASFRKVLVKFFSSVQDFYPPTNIMFICRR